MYLKVKSKKLKNLSIKISQIDVMIKQFKRK